VFSSPARIFAWSNSNLQGQEHNYNVVGNEDLLPILLATTGTTLEHPSFGNHFSANVIPELTVLFVSDSVYPSVEGSLKKSSGSLVLPYVNSNQDQQISAITEFASQVESVVFAGPSSLSAVVAGSQLDVQSILDKIESGYFNNGQRDLVVVDLSESSQEEAENVIAAFNQVIGNQQAVAVFIKLSTLENTLTFPKAIKKFIPIREVLDYGQAPPYPNKWPAYVVEALWVSAFLIAIGVVGIVCTCQIQGPLAFETKPKAHSHNM